MRYGSVCSGIEAATCAWHPLGWQPQFFCEIDRAPASFLAKKYPDVTRHHDMTKFKDWPDHAIELLVGGTPCQSFSVAGLRKGLADPRGNLALVFLAIADRYRPRWVVWENVPGVLSSNGGRDFGSFLGGLGELGYGFAYRVLDAQYVRVESHPRAVPQRRRRVFVVGHLGDWRRAAAVLFERESLCGDSPPRREAGKGTAHDVAPSLDSSGRGVERGGDTRGQDPVVAEVASCLNAHYGDKQGLEDQRINQGAPLFVAHALRREGHDASEDGTGRGTPIIPEVVGTLKSCKESGGWTNSADHAAAGYMLPIAIQGAATRENPESGPDGIGVGAVATQWAVRRLTPLECTRLQGFPEYRATLYVMPCSLDHLSKSAAAENQCRKSQNNAALAKSAEFRPFARFVELHSNPSPQDLAQHAALHVLINSGREEVRINRAGKLIWFASAAEKQSASAQHMPIGDFVRLVVAMSIIAAKTTRDGRADRSLRTKHFTHPENGHWRVETSGSETSQRASDAAHNIAEVTDLTTCIISSGGHPGLTLEQTAQILFSCAAAAIASYIQPTTLADNSCVLIEIEQGYFDVPNKPFADGPVYKMLGNSMAVNVMRWIGERIAAVDVIP